MDELVPVERYTPQRRAEFLLSNAVDAADDALALEAVRQLGLDPATIAHQPPDGVSGVDRVFLDANILFSVAYRRDAGLHQLWEMPAITLVASAYAVGEARRNQDRTEQRAVLEALLQSVQVLAATSGDLDVRDRLAEDFLMAVGEHVEIEAETTVRPTVISGTLSGLMTGWGCRYGTLDDTADHPQGTLLAASIGVLSGRNRCGIGAEGMSEES
jgi:hypothetical protein